MKTPAPFAAAILLLPFAAAAQGAGGYSATPAAAPTVERLMTRTTLWKCAGASCTAPRTAGSHLAACQRVRQQLGPLVAFTANGTAFAPEQLEKCNGKAG